MGNITLFSQIFKKIERFSFQVKNRFKEKNTDKGPLPILKRLNQSERILRTKDSEKTLPINIFLMKVELSTRQSAPQGNWA